ncbi:hypothetical protein ACP179_17640 [Xenorhabdus stockiae]|uniref:hypothetical protein n=1 Tax=Xenorhabdus stockiae TaxID=351614 RepID=UPI003CE85625
MATTTRPVIVLGRKSSATGKMKPQKDNAKSRRLAKQMAFWDRKRAEHEAKPKSRSVSRIIDSIVRIVNENDIYARIIMELKKYVSSDNGSGSCCMSDVALYSTRTKSRRWLESGGITARA